MRVEKYLWMNPVHFISMGAGLGLMPIVPGTFGSLWGIVFALLLRKCSVITYSTIALLAFLVGVWFCDKTSKALGGGDAPSIVWDEAVGMMITLVALPLTPLAIVCGFFYFRLFDIIKPWPISWFDQNVKGGLGIMIDDVIAGVVACCCVHASLWCIS